MVTMPRLITTDPELSTQAGEVFARWNYASIAHLYVEEHAPTPADTLADYVLPSWSGYAGIDLAGRWSVPVQERIGVWSISTDILRWSGSGPVWGVLVVIDGVLVAAGSLPTPIVLVGGENRLLVRLVYQLKSHPGGDGEVITVEEVDGEPTVEDVSVIQIDVDGAVSEPTPGTARISFVSGLTGVIWDGGTF